MEPLAKLLVSFLDLAEAELKVLKNGTIRLGLSLVMIIGAGIFGVIGLCWVLEAVFLVLEKFTGRAGAFAVSGVVFLAAAAALGLLAFRSTKVKTPLKTETHPPKEGPDHDPAVSLRIAS